MSESFILVVLPRKQVIAMSLLRCGGEGDQRQDVGGLFSTDCVPPHLFSHSREGTKMCGGQLRRESELSELQLGKSLFS